MSQQRRDRSKLSFSDLDKLRRERRQGDSRGSRESQFSNRAQKSYRAALEQAFNNGTVAELAATMKRARHTSVDLPQLIAPTKVEPAAAGAAQPGSESASAPEPSEAGSGAPSGTPLDARSDNRPGPLASDLLPADAGLAAKAQDRAEQRRLAKKIADASSPAALAKAVDRYLARFERLPNDYEILGKALSHPKCDVVLQVLETLDACVAKQKPRRSRSLAVQLAILEENHADNEIRTLAAQVRTAL